MLRVLLVAPLAASLIGCEGDLVNLGASALTAGSGGTAAAVDAERWATPRLLFAQEEGLDFSNPTLTRDETVLYYTEQLGSEARTEIYTRRLQAGSWVDRSKVDLGLDELDASSPAISLDGSQLWFGQNVAEGLGGTDIWLSQREGDAWGAPQPVTALNSPAHDSPRPVSEDGLWMPLNSKRHGNARFQIYLASRATLQEPWQSVGRELLEQIDADEFVSSGGFLSADGLALYFASTRMPAFGSDLYVARRASASQPFGAPAQLAGVNSLGEENSPWLSADGERLYFASNRETAVYANQYALYVSERVR
jgi:WD40-like Beta Propeller Repeat